MPTSIEDLGRGWTDPMALMRWFTPPPWRTTEVEMVFAPEWGAALDQLGARFARGSGSFGQAIEYTDQTGFSSMVVVTPTSDTIGENSLVNPYNEVQRLWPP
ncbi:MAG: hypothetical protein RL531_1295 [Actinomycetota bacterium]